MKALPLEKKAELAVRAYIRHNHTAYEERLDDPRVPLEPSDFLYREIKAEAQQAVDAFLSQHRKAG